MKTFGYGLQAFAGGFQTGLGLGMERKKIKMIQDEQKRAEKLAKEKEENAMNWYNANKDSLTNFHTQSQDARSKLIFESVQYKKEWTDYLRDVEDFLQSGDLEGLKNLNNMEEERIKAERDMLGIGVRPENAFLGKYYSEESMEYAKKLQMGKLANKPIGTQMYEEQFGKLPAEAPKLTDTQVKLAEIDKLTFLTEKRRDQMKVDMLSKSDSATAEKVKAIRAAGGTNEQIIKALGGDISEPTPEGEAKRTDIAYWTKRFDDVTNEDEWNTTMRDLEMTDTTWKPKGTYKDKLISEVKEMADTIKRELLTPDNKFINDKAKEQYLGWQRLYEQKIREIMQKYPDIDINRFAKYLSIEEIKPVGFWKGLITGGGIAKGDYSVIDIKGW